VAGKDRVARGEVFPGELADGQRIGSHRPPPAGEAWPATAFAGPSPATASGSRPYNRIESAARATRRAALKYSPARTHPGVSCRRLHFASSERTWTSSSLHCNRPVTDDDGLPRLSGVSHGLTSYSDSMPVFPGPSPTRRQFLHRAYKRRDSPDALLKDARWTNRTLWP
jgi:hypothetical protein